MNDIQRLTVITASLLKYADILKAKARRVGPIAFK